MRAIEAGRTVMIIANYRGLDAVLGAHLRMDLPDCLRSASHLTRALAGIHAAQLIHQDIRPANILVAPETGEVQLADNTAPRDWAYVSPEQTGRMNRSVDYRTDFYSLGITLYRMLTGRLPFQGNDALEWTHCHIARSPPPPAEVAPDIPEAVSGIVMKLLAKLPEDRYQSAHGLQADLERCLVQWQACGRIDPFPLAADDVSDRFQIPHKLYGRDQERATLLAAFTRVASSGDAALVTVSGYSGIGKSSLVHELHQPIVRESGYFISGKFDQFMRDIPYATLTQAFRDLVQQLLAESEERVAGWRQRIAAAVGDHGQLIVDVLPQVELIIGKQAPVPALPATEAQNRFRLVFQRFLAVFTRQQHPLTLFLDDMQWADAASLQFIEHLLPHPDSGRLLLIAAYRDNEVSAAHPLMAAVEAIRAKGRAVIDIRLSPLSLVHLNQLVADTLHTHASSCEPLTRVIFERTEGNPFFFTQFLDALHKEGVLRHDPADRVWRWDLADIRSRNFADNVADLMAGKLRRLPGATQEALQLAACLGNKFDLRHLALVAALPPDEARQRLSAAAHEDLILLTDGSGKFLHDRIQQAAYALIPAARHAEVHLRIGRTLIAGMSKDEIDAHLFDVANQFNQGAALLAEPEEKARVAQINLRAARKAKASVAYASACVYLAAGMAAFDAADWDRRHELMFSLWLERAECEFLSGGLVLAEQLIAILLEHAASKVDRVAVYSQKIRLHVMKSECPQAVDSALACLHLFGIDMSAHPSWEQVQAECEQVWHSLGGRPIEDIAELAQLNDPEVQASMDILAALTAPAAFTDMHLLHVVAGRMANLSLLHGTTSASAFAYVVFGLMLGPSFHRYAEGYRFGKLGCELADKYDFSADKAQIYLAASLNALWTQPVGAAIELQRKVFRIGGETGDLFAACNSWVLLIGTQLLQGTPLDVVWRESETGLDFVRQVKYQDDVNVITSQQRFIANMQGRTASFSTFSDAGAFSETAFEAQLNEDKTIQPICRHWLFKLQARFLSGDHADALAALQKLEAISWAMANQAHLVLDYHYYAALTMAACYQSASGDEQRTWRELLTAHREQLREWAQNYAPTFGDKHALVAAEIARLEGRDLDAMRLYEQAIESARANGFVHHEGIAHEAAAGFYLARGSATAARAHLAEARGCFARWGAGGKVRQLEERYPQLRAQLAASSSAPGAGVAQLDALSVAKASQAISGPIVLDELVETLMRIVLENAGAQTGALLLVRGNELVLAAEAGVTQQAVPETILNYVRRSQEQVLLADATEAHPFSADPYLLQHRPKSVLCIPIVRQTTLVGLLYLENTLITHAFTPERVTVLELLASQAAISLENALLYADLQQENGERKRVEAVLREREARIRRLVESNIIGIFFWNLQGGIGDANDAFLDLVGYRRDELLSGKLKWTDFNPPEYAASDARAMEELRRTGTVTSYEKEFIRKDGTRIPVLIGGALLEGSQDSGVGFVLNLTERKQAEAERTARLAADAANRAKSAFLANMSHELRTPLNGILGYAQILQRDRTLDERQAAALEVIRQSGEQLLTLINDILDFAKIEASKLELYGSHIPLAEFLHVVTEMVAVRARQKGLDFISDIAPDLPEGIQTDERRLRQVLLNLLSNAVKFTDYGQVMLRVRFFPPARLRFEVQDTGIGIPEQDLGTIFEPFEQAGDVQRRAGGAGLGLAISRQFLRLMGSEIRVESNVGHGSTFWFELEVPVAKAGTLPPPKAVVSGYQGPRRKVLVVDDVSENRTLLSDMLGPLGFTVGEAANGGEGLEQARILRPDLILMDVVMPAMDGLEAMRRLRRLPDFRDVPVIAISASASGGDATSSLAAGANAFLPKPISMEQLLAHIGALLKLEWIVVLPEMQPAQEQDEEANLVAPPAPEMEILHHLARLGNMQDILQRANYLAELDERYRPFASQLSLLAKGYRSQAILSLVERYLESRKVS
jgi:PAS domain S-box-containing protein